MLTKSIQLRKSSDRGYFDHGWLKSFHSFSFAEYYDPSHMQYGALRVLNEDFIAPSKGFPLHGHHDMEIVTIVFAGELSHKDTLGNSEIIRPGEVQRMTAGTGIRHSEFNASQTQSTHLMQIWILPDKQDHKPGYEQKNFTSALNQNKLVMVASRTGKENSVTINQDVNIYYGKISQNTQHDVKLKNKKMWVQVVFGQIAIENQIASSGDGVKIENYDAIKLHAQSSAELIIFDL